MAAEQTKPNWRRRLKILGLGLLAFMVLFGLFGYFAGPPIARSVLLKALSQEMHRPVSLGEIRINPYAMSVSVTNLKIGDGAAGEVFGFDELFLDLDLASVFHAAPVVEEVRLTNPRVHLVRESAGRYNISDLLDEWLKPSDKPTPSFSVNNIKVTGGRVDFEDKPMGRQHAVTDINVALPFISNLAYQANLFTEPAFSAKINGAPLELAGRTKPFAEVQESELKLELDRFDLSQYLAYSPVALPFAVTGGQVDSDISLVFRQAPKEPATLNIAGQFILRDLHLLEDGQPLLNLGQLLVPLTALAPLNNNYQFGAVNIEGLDVFARSQRDGSLNWQALAKKLAGPDKAAAKPAADKPVQANQGLAKQPQAKQPQAKPTDAKAVAEKPGKPMVLSLDSFHLGKAVLRWQDGKDMGPSATLDTFDVKGVQVDASKQHVQVAGVAVSGLQLAVTRLADGRVAGLTAQKPGAAASAPVSHKAGAKPGVAAPAWLVEVGKIEVANAGLRLEDKAMKPASVQQLDITRLALDAFSTAPKAQSNLDLAALLNKKGSLAITGPVQLTPLVASLKVDLRGFELLPLQPYFSEKLNLTVTKGQLTATGDLAVNTLADGSLATGWKGELTVGNFHSVDKINSANFLIWRSLHLGRMNVALKPLSVTLGGVALTDFYAKLIVSPEGKLNVLQLVKKDESAETPPPMGDQGTQAPPAAPASASAPVAAAAPAAPASQPVPVRIDVVTLQGGTVNFTDNFIKPNYTATLDKIGGRISGLSSVAGSTADMDLRGAYDGAPVTIVGKLNPLSAIPALDIKAEVRGIELTPLSPYAGKYAGYAIEKGKLSLFLGYKITDNKLEAQNRIFLDQLTFGDKVDSPSATKLPVTLAVALLQNRRGEIDINLPISGSLDDPQFSVGGIIVQVIMNLLGKALTAPFALLGSLFEGGEELSHVDFAPGRAQLTPAAVKRLETLAKALDDRPALRLEISGRVDPETDTEGLRRVSLEHKVKARKLAQLVKASKEAGAADEVVVDDKEYLPLLEQAYKQEKFPKPRNFIGLAKSLPQEEMEKLMLANVPVGENELRELANSRAKVVADWLRTNSKVPSDRVFMMPPKMTSDGGNPKDAPPGRVDFSLK